MITKFSPIPEGFFGDSGLTATSANHIANLLKLRYETIENELSSLNFVTETMTIVGSDVENTVRNANVIDDVTIREKLDLVARCKGFIAFLREAIKCKNDLAKEIEDYESERPEQPSLPFPKNRITDDDVIAGMSIGDRVRYYAAEARAATYGKYIHPGGIFEKARNRAFESVSEPVKVAMAGRDTVFIKRSCAVLPSNIDAMILSLQAEHRKSEATLNGMRNSIEEAVKKDAQEKLDEYRRNKAAYDKELEGWRRTVDEIASNDEQARIDRRKVVEALKIVIPNEYRDLYNLVNG